MDPKQLSNLDPKLRETYERIMGTSVPTLTGQPAPTTTSTQPLPAQEAPKPIEPGAEKPLQPNNPPLPQNVTANTQPTVELQFSHEAPLPQKPTIEQLPPLPPIMETQQVESQPLMQNLNMNDFSDDVTKSPFLNQPNNTMVNPNPSPEEVMGVNQVINTKAKEKKKGKLLPIILMVLTIVFFVIYIIVWAKVFGLF